MKNEAIVAGSTEQYGFRQADVVYRTEGISPTLVTGWGDGHQSNFVIWREVIDDDESE